MSEEKALLKLLWLVLIFGVTSTAAACVDCYRDRGRIIDGEGANTGEFPFMAALEVRTKENRRAMCGGSLISQEWILTAAHCIYEAQFAQIYLGSAYRDEPEIGYAIWNTDFHIHPRWSLETREHDIALIRIPATPFCDHIKPIPLPPMRCSPPNYVGEFAICSGWGVRTAKNRVSPKRLHWTRVQIISNELCKTLGLFVDDTEICLDVTVQGTPWDGDSGSHVFLERTGELIGVITRSLWITADVRMPMMAARVTHYLPWITTATGISSESFREINMDA